MNFQAVKFLNDGVSSAIVDSVIFSPGAGDEWRVGLFKNNPTLGNETLLADLEEANFDGYAKIACAAGTIGRYINPVTGAWEIRPKEPAGAFEYHTTGVTNLPQTIYGAFIIDSNDELLCAGKFEAPIVLTAADQVIDVSQPILQLPFEVFEEA